ncbi:MAG TPA: CHAD domain-containing protein, partial [Thermoleophilia bacterium]|nr:CHAD domain-containing protein [Thermoleophilia bacterium]
VAAGAERRDADTFLDTPARRLLAAGYYFRRRETDDGVRLTLKQLVAPADGVLRREEIEALVAADVPLAEWPAGELRTRVEQLTGGEPLEAMLTLSQVRVARVVRKGRREVAELSLDRVTASAHDGDRGWLEVEVEARGRGGDADVLALAAALRDEWGLTPEGRAKFTRALELAGEGDDGALLSAGERALHEAHASAGGARARRAEALLALDRGLSQVEAGRVAGLSDRRVRYWLARYRVEGAGIYDDEAVDPGTGATAAPAAEPKKRPDILPSDTMTEAAAKTLRFHLAKMLEHEEGTRLGEDPEELHDMRVSTRRMRMALRVFADYLDPDVLRPVLKGLRRTGRTLGNVRDLDVFNEKTQVYLDGLPDERAGDLDGLLDAWKAERDKQREALVDFLDGKRYRRFVERTQELLDGPVEALAPQNIVTPRPQRVAQVLPGVLYKDMAVVWAFEGQLGGLETPLPRFHALRKSCKGLRYTLEFFEGVLGSGARPLIKRVKGLQDHLGDLQDAVVTSGVLRDYLTWGTWRHEGHELPGPIEVIVAPGAARYLCARQEEMERLVLTFPEVWPTVAGNEFSRDLAAVIAEI